MKSEYDDESATELAVTTGENSNANHTSDETAENEGSPGNGNAPQIIVDFREKQVPGEPR